MRGFSKWCSTRRGSAAATGHVGADVLGTDRRESHAAERREQVVAQRVVVVDRGGALDAGPVVGEPPFGVLGEGLAGDGAQLAAIDGGEGGGQLTLGLPPAGADRPEYLRAVG